MANNKLAYSSVGFLFGWLVGKGTSYSVLIISVVISFLLGLYLGLYWDWLISVINAVKGTL